MKKVSVVLPVYNGERYLAQSIESVLSQTYQDLELIIVDDCSTDKTPEIIRRFARQDSRVRVIRNAENQKLPGSLNIGFRRAKGDYYTWTSDDNYYDEDAIETMVLFLEKHPEYGMLYCDMNYSYEENAIELSNKVRPVQDLYLGSNFGACFLYRREAAEATGEYDPDMFLVEDYDFVLRLFKNFPIYYLPVRKYTYRIHGASLSMSRTKEVWKQFWRLRRRELDFLLEKMDEPQKQFLFVDMWLIHGEETLALRDKFFARGRLPERLKWIEERTGGENLDPEDERPFILFGAGENGQRAVRFFGAERIKCFVDNNPNRVGMSLEGVPIVSFARLKELYTECQLVLTVGGKFLAEIVEQLEAAGITKYYLFLKLWLKN